MIGLGKFGLGQSDTVVTDCSQWTYWISPLCWSRSPSEWQAIYAARAAGTYPAPPALPAPVAPSTVEQLTQPGAWTPDMAIQATDVLGKQQQQAFFTNLAATLPSNGSTVDCSSFWNALTNSACKFSDWTGGAYVIPVLVGAGVLVLLAMRR
jgi:hypothetical protein